MEYISDSDGDNSLPVLSPDWVDKRRLREVLSILSHSSKLRIQAEARGTPLEQLYLEQEEPELTSQEASDARNDTREPQTASSAGETINLSETNPPSDSIQPRIVTIESLPLRHPTDIPAPESTTEAAYPTAGRFGRSLRKRTFASRHPYIADQADWLGICTVDSINEMFNEDEELSKVVRALNQLYLKRKKRYPDEDRYKAKNFYAHLGKSKLLALTGDQDVSTRDILSQNSTENGAENCNDADMDDYETDEQANDDDEDEEQLIPYEGLMKPPRIADEEHEQAEASSSEENESSEEEQLIRIGGKYRKLSRILRGVLPESARRLTMFQQNNSVKKKAKMAKTLQPRRGLAVKKFGSSSVQSEELRKELNSFIDTAQFEEDYTPNHKNLFQQPITDYTHEQPMSHTVSELSSSSDSDSESVEELFSDNLRSDITPSVAYSKADPHLSYIDVDSDSAQEADSIDYMFASKSSNRKKSKNLGTPGKTNGHALRATPRVRGWLTDSAKLSKEPSRTRKRSYNRRSSLGTIKKRKLESPTSHRTNNVLETPSKPERTKGSINFVKENAKDSTPISNKKTKEKPIVGKHGHFQRPTDKSFRRDPIMSTTVYEVESSSRFVHSKNSPIVSNPEAFMPSRSFLFDKGDTFAPTNFLPANELSKVSSIGDGHIFFSGEDDVVFNLAGKRYSLGLYRVETSSQLTERYFQQLHKLVLDPSMILNPSVRTEIHLSLKLMAKWILIARKQPLDSLWRNLQSLLNDFTKLQTRNMRQLQSAIHCRVIFIVHVYCQIEASQRSVSESKMLNSFEVVCSDFWTIFFQSFSASEISHDFTAHSETDSIADSLKLMYYMFKSKRLVWWDSVSLALNDCVLIIGDKNSLLDVVYILASIVPHSHYNWGCFLAVLKDLRNAKHSLGLHHFIDICSLANQRLDWPLEERVVTQLYSIFTHRTFGNFADETSVPQSLGEIHTRLDIPAVSVFDRFMGMLYTYVSDLPSKKDVKRLVSKLIPSSQYQYHSGRKYQIQFVNRINLMSLLSQISDVDLSGPFVNLVELITNSKDMFIYGRTVDALVGFGETANKKGGLPPLQAFEYLIDCFCLNFKSIFGMPDLLKRLVHIIGQFLQGNKDTNLFRLLTDIDMSMFPDGVIMTDLLSVIFFAAFEVLSRKSDLSQLDIDVVLKFQKTLISFIGFQMGRISILESRQQERVEEGIEISIQIWMLTASITGTLHWNSVMLQKYPYIGNSDLRERFLLFLCEEYMKSGPIDSTILEEIDSIMLKGLSANSISPYALPLYLRLSKTPKSIFLPRKPLASDIDSVNQMQTFRSQIVTSVIQNLFQDPSHSQGTRKIIIKGLIINLEDEYSKHYDQVGFTDFCKLIVDVIQKSAKSILGDMNEFWEFAVKLGFPNRKLQLAWSESNELDRLQMLNNEFLNALQYKKDLKSVMDNWISASDLNSLYSLVQIYISAISIHESYWAHLSHLLKYVLTKLQAFEIRVQDNEFRLFLDMLLEITTCPSPKSSNYATYEVDTIILCASIYRFAFYVYDGFKDKLDLITSAAHLVLEGEEREDSYLKTPFTRVTFGMLRSVSHTSFVPSSVNTDHTAQHLMDQATSLRIMLKPPRDERCLDFHFEL